jgi:hypothetical protein
MIGESNKRTTNINYDNTILIWVKSIEISNGKPMMPIGTNLVPTQPMWYMMHYP